MTANKSNDISPKRMLELSVWAINHHLRRNTTGYACSYLLFLKDSLILRDQIQYELALILDAVSGQHKTQIVQVKENH